MGKTSTLKAFVALLLTVLLFLCVAALTHVTTKTFAAYRDATVTPTTTISVTPEPSPSPTSQPSPSPTIQPSPSPTIQPSPTPKPSPTMAPSPTPTATFEPTATPIPTATSIPTVVPSPTVAITPTVIATPTVVVKPTIAVTPTMTHPTPVATQKAGAGPVPLPTMTQMPTVVSTQPTTAPADMTTNNKKSVSPLQDPLHSDAPMMPLVVGTLLTLCLGAGGFVGVRRIRTALLPALAVKKQRNHTFARSWQRVRVVQSAEPPMHAQETLPFSPVLSQDNAVSLPNVALPLLAVADEGPKTGSRRRLGPVRLRKMTKPEPIVLPVEAPVLPTGIEDMSFLDDPLLQDTLRHYRQKGNKED